MSEPSLRPLRRRRLRRVTSADTRRRHLFDPRSGPFRRLERAVSQFLSRSVFPRIPAIHRIYELQLERLLTVTEVEVSLPDLSPSWSGSKLLLIADLHAGPFVSAEGLARMADRLRPLGAEVILLGGDLLTSRIEELATLEPALRRLSAPHGVWAVLGNHDHYVEGVEILRRRLAEMGIRDLTNRCLPLAEEEDAPLLAGVDDWNAGRPDLDAALPPGDDGAGEGRRVRLLLSHNPDAFFEAADRGVHLVLSGHTHGGQIRLPGLPVLVRQSRYRLDDGRYRYRNAELVVSRGVGVAGLPLRLFCAPEVLLVTLRAAACRSE